MFHEKTHIYNIYTYNVIFHHAASSIANPCANQEQEPKPICRQALWLRELGEGGSGYSYLAAIGHGSDRVTLDLPVQSVAAVRNLCRIRLCRPKQETVSLWDNQVWKG